MFSISKKFIPAAILLQIVIFLFSFESEDTIIPPSTHAKKIYTTAFNQFIQSTEKLENTFAQYQQNKIDSNELRNEFIMCRKAYKQVEFFLAYFDPEAVKANINGAPLPSLEPNAPGVNVLAPSGLQILDELLFEATSDWDAPKITSLMHDLKADAHNLYLVQKASNIYDRHVFEALRSGLLRIFTLGVTGFDTPSSGVAIDEAKTGFESMFNTYKFYAPHIRKQNEKLADNITNHFETAIEWLTNNNDFDSFDRLTFLKTYINPIYNDLLDAQLALGVETIYETTSLKIPINYNSGNLFDEDFLNPYFYVKLSKKEDNDKVRELGKTLFFDPVLSGNGKRACASCHDPQKGFADGVAKSMAFDFQGDVGRNAPTVINAAYATKFFHDMRSENLDAQIEQVVLNPKEFHTNYIDITKKLKQSEEYVQLFKEAFPGYEQDGYIFKSTVSFALASYIISLKSFNSPFDQYVRGETAQIADDVKRGFNLFMGKAACGTCHFAPVFNGNVPPNYQDSESEVLGVTKDDDLEHAELDQDLGRIANKKPQDEAEFMRHAFKTPTVRNIELTAPYMHNGAYKTLEKVMDFYNKGGGAGLGLNVHNQTLPFDSLALNQQEVNDIIAFMKSLTDTAGITSIPETLPQFKNQPLWNTRQIGGEY